MWLVRYLLFIKIKSKYLVLKFKHIYHYKTLVNDKVKYSYLNYSQVINNNYNVHVFKNTKHHVPKF